VLFLGCLFLSPPVSLEIQTTVLDTITIMQRTLATVATVALAAASAVSASSVSPGGAAAASASNPVGTPVAPADAVPSSASAAHGDNKDERIREATRNLLRKKIEAEAKERQEQQEQQQRKEPKSPADAAKSKAERRRRAAEKMRSVSPDPDKVELVTKDELDRIVRRAKEADPEGKAPQNQWLRRLAWWDFGGVGDGVPSDYQPYSDGYADPGYDWDYWAQAYRMLGGFIDCDWQQGEEEPGSYNQRNRDLSGNDNSDNACGRWMMWAAYVNPNYQGGGYDEYFGCDGNGGDCSALDCHSPDTDWELIGVYREEFYQYLEQISKHLWAVDDYEYAVALGGLAYMSDADCFQAGDYYAGILPMEGGTFQMSVFEDDACLYPVDGVTYDDVAGNYNNRDLAENDNEERDLSGDADNCRRRLQQEEERALEDYGNYYGSFDCDYYYSAQEYTLTEMNEVYDTFRYCTLCIDYPTYQDGYLIGDDGMDEDSIINQCWKFHSHDSFPCSGDCIAKGSMQGSIIEVQVGSTVFGQEWEGASQVVNSEGEVVTSRHGATRLDRIKANLFLTFAGILFVATFLAFAVARGSGRERRSRSRSSKSRALLTADEKRRARSSSRHRSSRSKSKSRRSTSRGDGRSKSGASRGNSRSRRDYDSPRSSSRSKSKRSSGSRRHIDDF